jgi:hypothetical protein
MSRTTGGIFRFRCNDEQCEQTTFEKFAWATDLDKQTCPLCGKPAHRHTESDRQIGTDYAQPVYSESAGVHPSQVNEARKANPDHEYTDDGRMVFRSHSQRKRVLKQIGMFDRDGY